MNWGIYHIVYLCFPKLSVNLPAEVAHLVERNLAKVEVAGSSPVFRSRLLVPVSAGICFFQDYPGGGTGRRAGLKILWPEKAVRVQFPSRVLWPNRYFISSKRSIPCYQNLRQRPF